MKLLSLVVKISLFSILVMVLSQIPVGGRRICDHVGDLVHSPSVVGLTKWVARTFDFKDTGHFSGLRFRSERSSRADIPSHANISANSVVTTHEDFSPELRTLRVSGIQKSVLHDENEISIHEVVTGDTLTKGTGADDLGTTTKERRELESLLHR